MPIKMISLYLINKNFSTITNEFFSFYKNDFRSSFMKQRFFPPFQRYVWAILFSKFKSKNSILCNKRMRLSQK